MQRLLEHWGYTVYVADSVQSALEVGLISVPDLLISDIELPDGSGLDLLRALQTRISIHGIVHSGHGMEDDIIRSMEAGFFEHLVKPVALPKLRDTLRRLVPQLSSSQPIA